VAEPVSLLPRNATPWETAISLTSAERHPIPAELVKTVWNADTCPAHILDILANELSVDLWDTSWDDQRKRNWIKRSIPLHKIKGTLACISEYLAQAGGEIVRVTRPPEGFVLADTEAPAEREAWVRSLPQIRIYQDRVYGVTGDLVLDVDGVGTRALASLLDPELTGHKCVLVDGGVETTVGIDTTNGMSNVIVSLPTPLNALGALGFDEGCLASSDDLAPVYALAISDGSTPTREPVRPAARLQIVTPDYTSELMTAVGAFGDMGAFDADYFADELVSRVYYRIPIVKPSAATKASIGAVFGALDVSRFSMAPHTAELAVDIPGVWCEASMAFDLSPFDTAAWDNDVSRLDAAFDAICCAKRMSDKITANTNNYRALVAGTPLYAGEPYRAGDWIRS
jgi:phage tail P2-like protein